MLEQFAPVPPVDPEEDEIPELLFYLRLWRHDIRVEFNGDDSPLSALDFVSAEVLSASENAVKHALKTLDGFRGYLSTAKESPGFTRAAHAVDDALRVVVAGVSPSQPHNSPHNDLGWRCQCCV